MLQGFPDLEAACHMRCAFSTSLFEHGRKLIVRIAAHDKAVGDAEQCKQTGASASTVACLGHMPDIACR